MKKAARLYVRSIQKTPLFNCESMAGKIRERLRAVDGFRADIKPACPERPHRLRLLLAVICVS